MIVDQLERADLYLTLHPRFAAAFAFLRETDWSTVTDGRHAIVGDELFVIVERTNGRGMDASPVEHHRRYIDIQYVVAGDETLGWMPTDECRNQRAVYDASRDIAFYDDRPENWLALSAGKFVILYPHDGHAPLAGSTPVHKAVIKVQID